MSACEKDTPAVVLHDLGIDVESVFVPFSQSRNKDARYPNLNWYVTIKRNGRDVLTTEYSAGMGHCPSYKQGDVSSEGLCHAECEHGRKARWNFGTPYVKRNAPRIEPDAESVIFSVVTDSDVLDSSGFEDWAENYGYDTDSRQAESIYRACLDIALKMRAAFGEEGMMQLREVFQDY